MPSLNPKMPDPTTPISAYRSAVSTPDTGSWRHPAMDTIVERNKSKGLPDVNVSRLVKNALAFVSSFALMYGLNKSTTARDIAGTLSMKEFLYYGSWILLFLRVLFIYNIAEALWRLTRYSEPDYSDLALTPIQRKLLGLDPNVPTTTHTSGIITPPRYPKSSPSSSNRGSPTFQPRNPSPTRNFINDDSPATPSPSPLRSGTSLVRGFGATELGSLGSSMNTLNSSFGSNSMGGSIFNTPTPTNRHSATTGSSVPVGNKWVYEKMGKRGEGMRFSPGKSSLFSPTR